MSSLISLGLGIVVAVWLAAYRWIPTMLVGFFLALLIFGCYSLKKEIRLWVLKKKTQRVVQARSLIGKTLLEKRIVVLNGKMTGRRCERVFGEIAYLNEQGSEPIRLYINSPGGFDSAMRLLANGITSSKSPVVGIVVGSASSAAAILLQFCAQRLALPYASLFFHECRTHISIDAKNVTRENMQRILAELTCDSQELQKEAMEFEGIVTARSGLNIETLKAQYEKTLSVQEALELGLIDAIITKL